jgi:hypothetical protein
MSSAPSAGLFLRPLESYHGKIPFIVTDLLSRLRDLGAFSQKGIFRVAGVKSEVTALVELLDKGRVRDWSKFANLNTIAAACKRWFHDQAIDDPLIPKAVADQFLDIPNGEKPPEQVIREYKLWMTKISTVRKLTLAYLIRALKEVSEHPEAAMNPKNLGVVFAPCLFFTDPAAPIENLREISQNQSRGLQVLIENCEGVFEEALKFDRFMQADWEIAEVAKEALAVPPAE